MSRILLFHHLGLGDHIMCHGIVREYAKRYEHVTIFSYVHNHPSVAFMFRDLGNVEVMVIKDVDAARDYIRDHGSEYDEVKVLGFEQLDRTHGTQLEKQFYDAAGVPLAKKWESFHVDRDLRKEQELFELAAPGDSYAFVHEDTSRKYLIKRGYIGKHYTAFFPSTKLTENALDYCTLIERAKEVHVIDSSFMFLIDCLPYDNPEQTLYVHRYARENSDWQLPILKKDWHILTAEPSMFDPLRTFLERLYAMPLFPFTTTFFKRSVRWFFRQMLWTMGQPKTLAIEGVLRRYVPERSFLEIGEGDHRSAAQTAGATVVARVSLDQLRDERADVVLITGPCPEDLTRLHSAALSILILAGKLGADSESRLEAAGFGVREQRTFPDGTRYLVCRTL